MEKVEKDKTGMPGCRGKERRGGAEERDTAYPGEREQGRGRRERGNEGCVGEGGGVGFN